VTWGEWKKVRAQAAAMGYDIGDVGEGISDSHPVGSANWFDAVKWCNLRAEMEGLTPVYRVEGSVYKTGDSIPDITPGADGYRLPTELEWEWAARGGTSSKGYAYSGGNDLDAVAWHAGNNPSAQTRPVGTKAPNELGLTDMSGNVREWCWDADKSYRRFRGGGINDDTFNCNVAGIDFNYPNRRTEDCGLRLVRKASN
jgi:formylglycine-generating enzyme required for sulfatase activity